MEELKRRLDKIESNCPAQVLICGEAFKAINERLSDGNVRFQRHESDIAHTMKEVENLKLCTQRIKDDVSDIKSGWAKILAGIAVACVLLVINAAIMIAGG